MPAKMVEGFTLYPVPGSYLGRAVHGGRYEVAQTAEVKRLVRSGWTFIDVGAGIGYYSLLAAQLVGPRGRVIAYEPTAANYQSLLAAIDAAHARSRIIPQRCAVSDVPGVTTIATNPSNNGDNRLVGRRGWPLERVAVVTLDGAMERWPLQRRRVFIKIDVQGAEQRVLRGAARLIADYRPLILTEDAPCAARAYGEATTLRDDLAALGYRWREVGKRRAFCDLICAPVRL